MINCLVLHLLLRLSSALSASPIWFVYTLWTDRVPQTLIKSSVDWHNKFIQILCLKKIWFLLHIFVLSEKIEVKFLRQHNNWRFAKHLVSGGTAGNNLHHILRRAFFAEGFLNFGSINSHKPEDWPQNRLLTGCVCLPRAEVTACTHETHPSAGDLFILPFNPCPY